MWEYLPEEHTGDLLFAAPENGGRRLPPYLGELVHLARLRPDWDRYAVIFAWELRSAVATALLRRLGRKRRARFVVVGPILKGAVLKALPIVRWLLADADRIVCFSSAECDAYARLLCLPRARFVFLPTPWRADEELTDRDEGYILALGQSNRDYGTLLRAVQGTEMPVVVVAGDASALGGMETPPNVTVRFNTGHDETNDLIAGASLHCIPLHAAPYSSGQTVLLRAMSRGKAVVVTDTPGIRDYVENEETGLLVPPGDVPALRAALERLWKDRSLRERIGSKAARTVRERFGFPRFTQQLVEIAADLRSADHPT